MLSLFSISNFIASPINSMLFPILGPKKIVLIFSGLTPLCFLALNYLQSVTFLYVIVMMIGIARGTISIYVYSSAENQAVGKSRYVFELSIVFVIGTFVAPLLTSILMNLGLNWTSQLRSFL